MILSFISIIVVPLPKEKSCLTSKRIILEKLKLLPNHYLNIGNKLINSSF